MAWRIDEAVVRGEIDNTVEGRVTGRIWLAGRQEPLDLDLAGDCWRDLAGTRLAFVNPTPKAEDLDGLETRQRGQVGDITASRKNKVLLIPYEEVKARHAAGEEVPVVWKNTLYLEWFSERNGRVVIETTDFELMAGERLWEMDEDSEEAQKLANLQAMRDAMEAIIRRPTPDERSRTEGDDDEFAWEERLKESDRLTDAYQEVLEKYMDDAGAEQKEAFVMGWDGLLETLADKAEGSDAGVAAGEFSDGPAEEEDEGDDWREEDEELFRVHPLQDKSQDLVLRAMDLIRAGGDHPAGEQLTSALLQVTGKLAGALNGDYEREAGYVLAILKRCLNWLNDAGAACGELIEAATDPDHRKAMEAVRVSLFDIRDEIVTLRRALKQQP